MLHFTLNGIRRLKGVPVCTKLTVTSNYFSLSMTSDNTFLTLYHILKKSLLHIVWVLEFSVCKPTMSVLIAAVSVHVNLQLCVLQMCVLLCVHRVCVFSRLHKHYVLLSLSSSAEQNPNRQQEIRQAWSPITTTMTIERPPCIPTTRKWAN